LASEEPQRQGWAKSLADKLSSVWQRPSRAEKSAARARKAPTQGELGLSLDLVRVVRNDLSDSDLEIVPVKLKAKPMPIPAQAPMVASVELVAAKAEQTSSARSSAELLATRA
jgi:hypothetical protein